MKNHELYNGYDIFEDNDGWWAGMNEPDGWACHGPHASREAAMEYVDAQSEGRNEPDGDPERDRAAQAALEMYQNSDHSQ